MRILHLNALYPPHIVGGAERSVELLAETQARLGHIVGAACLSRKDHEPEERNGVTVFRMAHRNAFWMEDANDHSRIARSVAKLRQPFNTALASQFGENLDRFRPDVLHTHSMVEVTSLVWGEATKRGIPITHTLRDYDLLCTNSGMFKNGRPCAHVHFKCRLLTSDNRLRHRHIGAVAGVGAKILQGHVSAGYFAHVPPERRAVIWNPAVVSGADDEYVKPRRSGLLRFGYLGRISEEKGIGTVLSALRALPIGTWQLLVAGKAPGSDQHWREMASGMPVAFAGFVEPKTFFEDIDVLIVPSIWAEPLPRTILEAYAMGVPALGARSGGIPDLIGATNDSWLFEPGCANELAERLTDIVRNGREMLPDRRAFDAVLEQTKPDVVAAKYLKLYET